MLRTIFAVGIMAFVGLFLLKLIFGVLGGVLGLIVGLIKLAIPIFILGLVVYILLRIFAPDTARRMKERWSEPRT